MKYLPFVLLSVTVIFESSITVLPFVLLFLLIYAVITRSEFVFLLAFISGILLDILLLRPIGITSAFYLLMLFLVLLYDRKFEIGTHYFIAISSFFFTWMYFLLFPTQGLFLQGVICVIISLAFFTFIQRLTTPKVKVY